MSKWPELFFARHGETAWNLERRYQGSKDIPLNETGQKQADGNGPLLRRVLASKNIDPASLSWFASPLGRAAETMQRMRAAFDDNLPDVIFDDRLKEISFGVLEGRLHHELPKEMATAPGEREGDYWYHRPENGENYADVAQRLADFSNDMSGPAVIVAHGGIWRVMRYLLEDISMVDAVNWHPPQGTVAHYLNGDMRMYSPDDLKG